MGTTTAARLSARLRVVVAAAAVALLAAACSPLQHTQGYTPRAEELESIVVGADTRQTVQAKLGRPSTLGSFDDDAWYYISIKTEQLAFYAPQVIDQTVVAIGFDETGAVSDVGRYGVEDGQVIDLVTRTTPTGGRRLTIIQQIFQNLGRFGDRSNLLDTLADG